MDEAQLSVLMTVAGAAVAVAIITEIIIRAAAMTSEMKDRFGPLMAVVIGILVVEVAAVGLGIGTRQDIVQGLFSGIFAGASAMGIHDVITGPVAKTLQP